MEEAQIAVREKTTRGQRERDTLPHARRHERAPFVGRIRSGPNRARAPHGKVRTPPRAVLVLYRASRGTEDTLSYVRGPRFRFRFRSGSVVQRLAALVDPPRVRAPLPRRVLRALELLDGGRQLVEARVVDDQDAVEVVELVLEG